MSKVKRQAALSDIMLHCLVMRPLQASQINTCGAHSGLAGHCLSPLLVQVCSELADHSFILAVPTASCGTTILYICTAVGALF